MKRLARRFAGLRAEGKKALSFYLTAGYPDVASTVPAALALAGAGADLLELGVPFSDPIADGPVIQSSSDTALRNGMTLARTIGIAAEIRKSSDIPLVLMGYANPLYAYGLEKSCAQAAAAGVDGLIVPDLPPEESEAYRRCAAAAGLATIFLAAPTTSAARLAELDLLSTGFLYGVSVTGVTGARSSVADAARTFVAEARRVVKKNPLLVGFGIASPDDAAQVAAGTDGVIIGSALIAALAGRTGPGAAAAAAAFARPMRDALDRL